MPVRRLTALCSTTARPRETSRLQYMGTVDSIVRVKDLLRLVGLLGGSSPSSCDFMGTQPDLSACR